MRNDFQPKNLDGIPPSRFQRLEFITSSPIGKMVAKPFKVFGTGIMAIGSRGDTSINKIKSQFRRESSRASQFAEEDGWDGDAEDNGGKLFQWENEDCRSLDEEASGEEEAGEEEGEDIQIQVVL
jgi:hypothetical protein